MGAKQSTRKQDISSGAVKNKRWQHRRRPREYDEIEPDSEEQGHFDRKYEKKPRPYDEVEILYPDEKTDSKGNKQLNNIQVEGSQNDKPRNPAEKTISKEIQVPKTPVSVTQ